MLRRFFVVFGLFYANATFADTGYLGIYNTTDENFVIGKVERRGAGLAKIKLGKLSKPVFERCIEDTEYLGEIIPAKGFIVIDYFCYGCDTALVELLSQEGKGRCDINLISDEKVTFSGSYKITYRFAGMCDYSIIPDRFLSHLCDRLIIISNWTFTERLSNCDIF